MTVAASPREGFLAGSFDLRPGSSEARRGELLHALRDEAGVRAAAHGALTLAGRGAAQNSAVGSQPVLCALEGAIYNLDDVARLADLRAEHYPAEALLAQAWARLGDELVARLRGDFAIVLWDHDAERGLVARDQLGGRGIVWHESGGRLLFASEVRHLLALLPATPGPDPGALAHWVANSSAMPADRSLYEGIRRLPAGHLIAFRDGGWEVRRYWQPRYRPPLRAPREELVAQLRATLARAVERRAPADGSAAILLSGGLDSASVAGVAASLPDGQRPARAYSATFPRHPGADETKLIDGLCDALGLQAVRAVVQRGSVLGGMLPYLEHWRLPPVSPNLFFWQPLLARASADGVTVMLDGEGGDEVFGHSPPLIADRLRHGRVLSTRELLYAIPGRDGPPSKEEVRAAARAIIRRHGVAAAAPAGLHRLARRLRGTSHYAPDWLTEPAARAYAAGHDPTAWKSIDGPRWWAHLVSITAAGVGPSLTYDHVRRRSAQAGLQARHPLMDVDVLELALTFSPRLAFDHRWSRPLLREAMAGLIPDQVRLRTAKSSFDQVFHEALAGPDLPAIRALLTAPDAELRAYVDLNVIERRLLADGPPAHPLARAQWAVQVWRLVTGECWLRMQRGQQFQPSRDDAIVDPHVELGFFMGRSSTDER